MRSRPRKISVIVTTYNRPQALKAVLNSLDAQSYRNFEVIVADDGSKAPTADLLNEMKSVVSFPLRHVWQEDDGFRAARIRNKAILESEGDYLIFLDGDCMVRPCFVQEHATLAEKGWFVAGNRILLNESFTEDVLQHELDVYRWSVFKWYQAKQREESNRFLSLINIPLGPFRKCAPHQWQGAKTCNLAMWREDCVDVNGFDETYEGWGFEDSDLVVRLLRTSVKRKSGHFATTVIHLWHLENDRKNEVLNRQRLEQILKSSMIKAKHGLTEH